jgi:tetratricopeptide (TPR) repeat protein
LLFSLRIGLCILATKTALAQSDDIFQRLRRALASSGESEAAVSALASNNFAEVTEMLAESKASTQADRAELLSLRGAVEFLDGKMSAAATAFNEAAKLAPLRDSDTFTLAMALVNLGADEQARSVLAGLATRYPERAIYVYWLGRLDYHQRRYAEAVEKLRKASQLDPKSARIWDSLGLAFDMQSLMEQALGALQTAVSLNRTQAHPSPWPPNDFGALLLRMGKWNNAEQAFRESLRYDPKLAQAHYHLGRALEKQGKETEAVDEYLTAVSGDPQAADACYSLAMLYRKLHRNLEANAMFAELKRRKEASPVSGLTPQPVRE